LKNGGSEIQYKVLNAVQSNIDHRRNQLQKNPQSVFAMDSGTPLQPLSPESALQQPGEWGAGLKQRQANSDAIIQKYGATAGKNLLTTEELGNAKDAYEKMSPDQRIQFWRNTQASSTPAIASAWPGRLAAILCRFLPWLDLPVIRLGTKPRWRSKKDLSF
jgi:hypothetical protein